MLSLPKGKDLRSTTGLGSSYQSSLIILNHVPLSPARPYNFLIGADFPHSICYRHTAPLPCHFTFTIRGRLKSRRGFATLQKCVDTDEDTLYVQRANGSFTL